MGSLFLAALCWSCLYFARCDIPKVLDLSRTPLRRVADIFNGTFSDGGVYRMIHHKPGFVPVVYYDYKRMKTTGGANKGFYDIYIEEYRRGEEVFVEFLSVYKRRNGEIGMRGRIYGFRHDKPVVSSRDALKRFINGGVLLAVDMNATSVCHPFIIRSFGGDSDRCSSLPEDMRLKMLKKQHYYTSFNFIPARSPDGSGVPRSSLISNSARIVSRSHSNKYSAFVPHIDGDVEYIVDPRVGSVIMKLGGTADSSRYWKPAFWNLFSRVSNEMSVVLNIGTGCSYIPNVLLLCNVPKGGWLYSLYEIAPYRDVRVLKVKAVDAKTSTTIYDSPPNAFVTRVESFVNSTREYAYVIVHFRMPDGIGLSHGTRIYRRLCNDSGKHVYVKVLGGEKRLYSTLLKAIYEEPDDARQGG